MSVLDGTLWYSFAVVRWGLAAFGLVTIAFAAMVARPLTRPPELASIAATARAVDRSTMPALQRFFARDGTELAYRRYPPIVAARPQVAILIHGSSGSSLAVHALARALAERGVEVFAPDIRGHGGSGSRGDISYLGQLEDDLADLVAMIRTSRPDSPLTLMGHSAGGGLTLRVAASPLQDRFARYVLLAPYLGYDSPTSRPDGGGWASPNIPRIIALQMLGRVGLTWFESLPVLALAVPPNAEQFVVGTYSYRLTRNFATRGYKLDLPLVHKPLTLFAATNDELMFSDKYADTVHALAPAADVRLIDGINHMEIVSAPAAISAIADDVAAR